MLSFLLKRLTHGLIVLWVVITLTFVLLRLAPGGPFDRERRLPPEVLANIEAKYHLEEPLAALENLCFRVRSLVFSDWNSNREVQAVLAALRDSS